MHEPEYHDIERPRYIKDAPARVFDTHVHFPWREGGSTLPGSWNCWPLAPVSVPWSSSVPLAVPPPVTSSTKPL